MENCENQRRFSFSPGELIIMPDLELTTIKEILTTNPKDIEHMTKEQLVTFVREKMLALSTSANFIKLLDNILADQYRLDYSVEQALRGMLETLNQRGTSVNLKDSLLKGYLSKLSDIRMLSSLVDVYGLTLYKETIVNLEIERVFGIFKHNSPRPSSPASAPLPGKK